MRKLAEKIGETDYYRTIYSTFNALIHFNPDSHLNYAENHDIDLIFEGKESPSSDINFEVAEDVIGVLLCDLVEGLEINWLKQEAQNLLMNLYRRSLRSD